MTTAYPGDVPGAVAAAHQHPALPGLLGFMQLALVVLHRTRMLGLGIDSGGLCLSLANGSEQKESGETNKFCHDELWQQGSLECGQGKPDRYPGLPGRYIKVSARQMLYVNTARYSRHQFVRTRFAISPQRQSWPLLPNPDFTWVANRKPGKSSLHAHRACRRHLSDVLQPLRPGRRHGWSGPRPVPALLCWSMRAAC